jgi:hypothetical protein
MVISLDLGSQIEQTVYALIDNFFHFKFDLYVL